MGTFLQVVVNGLLVGGLYGLFSSGLTLIFGITRVVNFAHGDFVTLGMFGAVVLFTSLHLNPLVAILPIAVAAFLLGALVYQTLVRRTLTIPGITAMDAQHGQMALTLGFSILVTSGLLVAFGPSPRSINGVLDNTYTAGVLYLSQARLVAFGIALLAFVLLYLGLTRTLYGKAIRGTVDDNDMASMVGINTNRVYVLSFSVGIMLTGIAGDVLATYYPATPLVGQGFLIIAFVTVVMGGLGNVAGAFYAGLLVGIIQQATATYVAIDLQNAGIFVAFVLVLLFRPQGLLGGRRVTA